MVRQFSFLGWTSSVAIVTGMILIMMSTMTTMTMAWTVSNKSTYQNRLSLVPSLSKFTNQKKNTKINQQGKKNDDSSSSTTSTTTCLHVLWDPHRVEEHGMMIEDDDENSPSAGDVVIDRGVWVDFPTAGQRMELKKETKKRLARKELPSLSLERLLLQYQSEDEEDDDEKDQGLKVVEDVQENIDDETEEGDDDDNDDDDDIELYFDEAILREIWETLSNHELVQIRGISKDDPKMVYPMVEQLCFELELYQKELLFSEQGQQELQEQDGQTEKKKKNVILPVILLSYKGHTSVIYSPTLPNDHPNKFLLRTSVGQKNTWKSRPKPERDNRGQVIKKE